jgi:hypothetical protein
MSLRVERGMEIGDIGVSFSLNLFS